MPRAQKGEGGVNALTRQTLVLGSALGVLCLASAIAGCVHGQAEGTAARRLTGGEGQYSPDGDPTWLPSNRVLFTGANGLFSINPDGSDLQKIHNTTGAERCSSVSPDGSKIAFGNTDYRPGGLYVSVMDSSGGEATRLTGTREEAGCPKWSPDGRKIAFYSDRSGTKELYIMNPDGSGAVQLTELPFSVVDSEWDPHGGRIAFIDEASKEILLIPSSGGKAVPLTSDGWPKGPGITWSPDGRWIVYLTAHSDEPFGLYALHPDGLGKRLILGWLPAFSPAFSPSGDMIAFEDHRQLEGAPTSGIYVIDVGDLLK